MRSSGATSTSDFVLDFLQEFALLGRNNFGKLPCWDSTGPQDFCGETFLVAVSVVMSVVFSRAECKPLAWKARGFCFDFLFVSQPQSESGYQMSWLLHLCIAGLGVVLCL